MKKICCTADEYAFLQEGRKKAESMLKKALSAQEDSAIHESHKDLEARVTYYDAALEAFSPAPGSLPAEGGTRQCSPEFERALGEFRDNYFSA